MKIAICFPIVYPWGNKMKERPFYMRRISEKHMAGAADAVAAGEMKNKKMSQTSSTEL